MLSSNQNSPLFSQCFLKIFLLKVGIGERNDVKRLMLSVKKVSTQAGRPVHVTFYY